MYTSYGAWCCASCGEWCVTWCGAWCVVWCSVLCGVMCVVMRSVVWCCALRYMLYLLVLLYCVLCCVACCVVLCAVLCGVMYSVSSISTTFRINPWHTRGEQETRGQTKVTRQTCVSLLLGGTYNNHSSFLATTIFKVFSITQQKRRLM